MEQPTIEDFAIILQAHAIVLARQVGKVEVASQLALKETLNLTRGDITAVNKVGHYMLTHMGRICDHTIHGEKCPEQEGAFYPSQSDEFQGLQTFYPGSPQNE